MIDKIYDAKNNLLYYSRISTSFSSKESRDEAYKKICARQISDIASIPLWLPMMIDISNIINDQD